MNDCPPFLALALAAIVGLAVLVGGLSAYACVVFLRRARYHREKRLSFLHSDILRRRS